MELSVKNVNYKYKNQYLLKDINFSLTNNYIYGLIGKNKTLLLEIIDDLIKYEGNISINGITNKNRIEYRKSVSLIKQDNTFITNRVIDEMNFIIKNLKYKNKDILKKEINSLTMVGLDQSFLEREFDTLSESEKVLVNIACNLLINPKVIIFDEIFTNLDLLNKKRILDLIRRLKHDYNKIIIISSNNTNLLYEHTDEVLVLINGELAKFDKTNTIFKDIKFLTKNNFDIPYLVDFTKKAKDKKIRLSYHKDILDLIKDVYKHV